MAYTKGAAYTSEYGMFFVGYACGGSQCCFKAASQTSDAMSPLNYNILAASFALRILPNCTTAPELTADTEASNPADKEGDQATETKSQRTRAARKKAPSNLPESFSSNTASTSAIEKKPFKKTTEGAV